MKNKTHKKLLAIKSHKILINQNLMHFLFLFIYIIGITVNNNQYVHFTLLVCLKETSICKISYLHLMCMASSTIYEIWGDAKEMTKQYN